MFLLRYCCNIQTSRLYFYEKEYSTQTHFLFRKSRLKSVLFSHLPYSFITKHFHSIYDIKLSKDHKFHNNDKHVFKYDLVKGCVLIRRAWLFFYVRVVMRILSLQDKLLLLLKTNLKEKGIFQVRKKPCKYPTLIKNTLLGKMLLIHFIICTMITGT